MQVFHCRSCASAVYFENTSCLTCQHELGFLPDLMVISALEKEESGLWRALSAPAQHPSYRKCRHFSDEGACNWMVPSDDPHDLCASCRLSRTIPDISQADLRRHWARLEVAKRRLIYSLKRLRLPILSREADAGHGLCFDFLSDTQAKKVITGHEDGIITINVAEADDAHREREKARLGEAYRTLLGHFRHEIGHFYWDRLISGSPSIAAFRSLFGDEQRDYAAARDSYYKDGAAEDWQQRFISSYASMHPWEDWAESFAHYLHMFDVIETGSQFGLSLRSEPSADRGTVVSLAAVEDDDFDRAIQAWVPLTYAINSLNRSMGLPDWYPFSVPPDALAKLRFIHHAIRGAEAATVTPSQRPAAPVAAMPPPQPTAALAPA
jgi:hypothetical protein